MLSGATDFPQAGSYGLLLSPAPPAQRRQAGDPKQEEYEGPQLVRIIRSWPQVRGSGVDPSNPEILVSLPLVDGASGTRTVRLGDLIDATPLTRDEEREFTDLDRSLRGCSMRTPRQKERAKRRDALKQRIVYAPILARQLRELASRQRRAA